MIYVLEAPSECECLQLIHCLNFVTSKKAYRDITAVINVHRYNEQIRLFAFVQRAKLRLTRWLLFDRYEKLVIQKLHQ